MIEALIRSPKTTGAISKYSKSSINNIFQEIDRSQIQHMIEFWPGDGNITKQILKYLPSWARLTCFEINKQDFESHLTKIIDPRLTIHYLSCEEINTYIDEASADIIISTIPLSLIDNTTVQAIVARSYTSLKPWGKFITGQYSSYAKQFLTPHFTSLTQRRHLRNLPPVCILTATKL